MSALFPTLFSAFEIRGKRFKNRIFLPAHGTGYADAGTIGERGLEYYRTRVTRSISLLITEATHVVALEDQKYPQLSVASDDCLPGLQKLAHLCAENECRLFGQLYHEGRARAHSSDGSQDVALAPSALPDERFHIMPRAMSVPMIEEMVNLFAAGAARLLRGGADGMELLVGLGYLYSQFLSPRSNLRTDRYGGSPGDRLRFLRETLVAARESTSDDFIIGIRIAGEEYDADGLRLEDTIEACQTLDRDGLIDYVNVSAWGTTGLLGTSKTIPSMFMDIGPTLPYARALREVLSVPVLTAGRINQPQQAEHALASGQSDMIGMVRAFIADPDFALKAEQDRPDDIRVCIACNQACIGHRHSGHGISCIQFPETGRELEYGTRVPAPVKKRIAVVGGGPGGIKAAVVAAERGHDVTLYEKSARLGGQVLLAQALPDRAEFGGLVTNLEYEIAKARVSVVRNVEVTEEMLLEEQPDAVIIATGAVPYRPAGQFEEAQVVTAWEVLENQVNVGHSVVVADWRCDWVGLGIAEKLAAEGCSVRLCVNGEMAGQMLHSYLRHQWAGRLHKLGVEVVPYMRLFAADSDTVYLQHVMSEEAVLFDGVDTLVLAYGHASVIGLYDTLRGKIEDLHAIGDCLSPRTAEEAVLEGLKVGAVI